MYGREGFITIEYVQIRIEIERKMGGERRIYKCEFEGKKVKYDWKWRQGRGKSDCILDYTGSVFSRHCRGQEQNA